MSQGRMWGRCFDPGMSASSTRRKMEWRSGAFCTVTSHEGANSCANFTRESGEALTRCDSASSFFGANSSFCTLCPMRPYPAPQKPNTGQDKTRSVQLLWLGIVLLHAVPDAPVFCAIGNIIILQPPGYEVEQSAVGATSRGLVGGAKCSHSWPCSRLRQACGKAAPGRGCPADLAAPLPFLRCRDCRHAQLLRQPQAVSARWHRRRRL